MPLTHFGLYGPEAAGMAITQSYLGYNTIGGTTETPAVNVATAKAITVSANAFCMSIDVYTDAGAINDNAHSYSAAVYTDNAGTPQYIIAVSVMTDNGVALDIAAGAGGNTNPRWLSLPCGAFLPAGDYWIAVKVGNNAGTQASRIYYDVGADRQYTSGGLWMVDWGFYAPTTTARKYSIRASMAS